MLHPHMQDPVTNPLYRGRLRVQDPIRPYDPSDDPMLSHLDNRNSTALGWFPRPWKSQVWDDYDILLVYPTIGFLFAHMRRRDRCWVVSLLAVTKEDRRQGYGSSLLSCLIPPLCATCIAGTEADAFWASCSTLQEERRSTRGTLLHLYTTPAPPPTALTAPTVP